MSYLTEAKLANTADIGISLPATELKQGDWLVLSSVKLVTPMRLTFKFLNIQIVSATVDIDDISNSNKVFGNLGLVFVTLRRDYVGGNPGEAGGLDAIVATSIGVTPRTGTQVKFTTPGFYSWVVANNTQPSSEEGVVIPATTSIDFRVCVTGTARLDFDSR